MTKLIAELGINHSGEPDVAKEMVLRAAASGCWGIKFQYRNLQRVGNLLDGQIGGDSILHNIVASYLEPAIIVELATLARSLNLAVGISFFTEEDVSDFSLDNFDFLKVPSAEMMNWALVKRLLSSGKDVLVSTGMHSEREIEALVAQFSGEDRLVLLHTVSNYPTRLPNSNLGFITRLKELSQGRIGYSSHDEHWETCLVALGMGIEFLERHVTLDKDADGLDQSSSSTFDEVSTIAQHCLLVSQKEFTNSTRQPNQGEKIGLQNLGRGLFAKRHIPRDTLATVDDFEYRSPRMGAGLEVFNSGSEVRLVHDLVAGAPLSSQALGLSVQKLDSFHLDWATKNHISLPIRPQDWRDVMAEIPLRNYEFHLSFSDVAGLVEFPFDALFDASSAKAEFSVHAPDYLDAYRLLNPFSEDRETRQKSQGLLQSVGDFALELAHRQGSEVTIVSSLSQFLGSRDDFFVRVGELFGDIHKPGVRFSLQWLPPYAWYFGGSFPLHLVNSRADLEPIRQAEIPITLDTSHLLMGANAGTYQVEEVLEALGANIAHIHVSGADGVDGEGSTFPTSALEFDVLNWILERRFRETPKVLEAWQGHLNGFAGFKEAIISIADAAVDL